MRSRFSALLLLPVVAVPTRLLAAQNLPPHVSGLSHGRTLQAEPYAAPVAERAAGAAFGAIAGGAVGLFVVGGAAYHLTGGGDICGDDPCGFVGLLLGSALGEAVGIGLGAHLGDGKRGDALSPIGASLGVLIAAGMVAEQLEPGTWFVVAVPILQIVAAVWAELATPRP